MTATLKVSELRVVPMKRYPVAEAVLHQWRLWNRPKDTPREYGTAFSNQTPQEEVCIASDDEMVCVGECIGSLPEYHRDLLITHYKDELPVDELYLNHAIKWFAIRWGTGIHQKRAGLTRHKR